MGPRLTAQHGIELLKIHQLRRENTAIYQQLQGLRDAVSDFKDEHEAFRDQIQKSTAKIESIGSILSKKQEREDKIAADVEMLFHSRDESLILLADLRTENKSLLDRSDKRYENHQKTLDGIEARVKELGHQHHSAAELRTAVSNMQDELAHKAEATDLDDLKGRLEDAEKRAVRGLEKQLTVETVLVQRSAEEETVPLETIRDHPVTSKLLQHSHRRPISCSSDSLFDDPDKITETASYDESELGVKTQHELASRVSSRSNDLEMNEYVNASPVCTGARSTSPSDSLVTLPHILAAKSHLTNDSFELDQGESETFPAYVTRGRQSLESFTIATEESEVHQFVDGMLDKYLKATLMIWLNVIGWTWQSLQEFVQRHNFEQLPCSSVSGLEKLAVQQVRLPSGMNNDPMSAPAVLLPQTPRKTRVHQRDRLCKSQIQPSENSSPSSPLLGRVVRTRKTMARCQKLPLLAVSPSQESTHTDAEVFTRSIEYMPLSPSPYNPKPRLVSRRKEWMLPSNDSVHEKPPCPREARQILSQSILVASRSRRLSEGEAQAEQDQRTKKKRKLPPPPGIPILPTSSEADKERFSRWYSPLKQLFTVGELSRANLELRLVWGRCRVEIED